MQYRRALLAGASYFFTVVTEQRRPVFAAEKEVNLLRDVFREVRQRYPFQIDAAVVMPDHLHCIWTLPAGDADYALRWRLIKTGFTKACDASWRGPPPAARQSKGQQAVWQNRYWEHLLRDDDDFRRHVEYIHYNPVKHGLVAHVRDWPYSSFLRYVHDGLYPLEWGADWVMTDDLGAE
ncbi:REP-associated tyrosine transposase [Vogesella indigofera]|uniref:REP-associated tyrosine transposase n=1 Tax=Vogesella indigofera TaxID=45465 RepID=UPI0035B2BB23